MTRVVVQEVETNDTWVFGYAITEDGSLRLPNVRKTSPIDNNGSVHWTAIWQDLPVTAVVFKVAVFREFQPDLAGRGFWEPVSLPSEQTPEQVMAVEKILRLHGLSLTQVVGKKQKWAKGGRHQ